ncbi:MAG: FtsX-like permease family protein [Bacillota bacterium]
MTALRYGFLGGWRNRQQTTLAVISVALATVFLSFAFVLSLSAPGRAYVGERAMVGGDIVVLPRAMVGPGGNAGDHEWVWQDWSKDTPGVYGDLFPNAFDGRLVSVTSTPWPAIERAVAGLPGAAFYPDYQMPALLHLGDKTILATIRARNPELDTRLDIDRYVQAGRALNVADNGQPNALIDGFRLNIDAPVASTFAYDRFNGDWAFLDRGWPMVVPEPAPATSTAISVEIPRVTTADGQMAFDYSSPLPLSLNVVGQYRINTGDWDWANHKLLSQGYELGARDARPIPDPFVREPAVWTSPQIFVTMDTFRALANQVGWNEPEPIDGAILLADTAQSRKIAQELQVQFPAATVLTISDLLNQVDVGPEPMAATPPVDVLTLRAEGAKYALSTPLPPSWVKWVVMVLAYVIGGLLFTANLWLVLSRRFKEVTVLRALGAARGQTFVLLSTEVVFAAVVGALAGWLVVIPLVMLQAGTSGVPIGQLWATVGKLLAAAEVLAVVVALPAALALSLRATQVPPAEVIRRG